MRVLKKQLFIIRICVYVARPPRHIYTKKFYMKAFFNTLENRGEDTDPPPWRMIRVKKQSGLYRRQHER